MKILVWDNGEEYSGRAVYFVRVPDSIPMDIAERGMRFADDSYYRCDGHAILVADDGEIDWREPDAMDELVDRVTPYCFCTTSSCIMGDANTTARPADRDLVLAMLPLWRERYALPPERPTLEEIRERYSWKEDTTEETITKQLESDAHRDLAIHNMMVACIAVLEKSVGGTEVSA